MYICIDLKSFYASVECVERGLDPLTARLVVADPERTDKTICLAVSPAMKALGVSNRCRVFEIPKGLDYIMAPPRMQKYIDYAAEIYGVYLEHIAPQDIHVYSIDEVFIDLAPYLKSRGMTARDMARFLMDEVFRRVGVRAACGIGTNLYLAKVALDITAKHAPDFIGELDEASYQRTLWDHRPLTDFWRIGAGTARRLENLGLYTMRLVAHADESILYKTFGIDAELLIDHAWGRETTTMADIKAFVPKTNCLTTGQVLMRDYTFEEGRLIAREMADAICLDMAEKKLVTASVSLCVGYANSDPLPPAKGSASFSRETNAPSLIIPAVSALYDRIIARDRLIRRFYITCSNVRPDDAPRQLNLFDMTDEAALRRDQKMQNTVVEIKKKFGKNAILRGMNLLDASTAQERNRQIGGHKSGE